MPIGILKRAPITFAEELLFNAHKLLSQKGITIAKTNPVRTPEEETELVALAIKLYKAKPVIKFRAIVEEWDRNRLVSEMSAYGY